MPFFESFSFLKTFEVSSRICLSPNSHISRADAPGTHFAIACSRTPGIRGNLSIVGNLLPTRLTSQLGGTLSAWPRVTRVHTNHNKLPIKHQHTHIFFTIIWFLVNLRLAICPASLYLVTTKSSAIVFSTSLSSAISQNRGGCGYVILISDWLNNKQSRDRDVKLLKMAGIFQKIYCLTICGMVCV